MADIINSGRAKFAAKQAANLPLIISHFVFAFIDGLDPEDDVDLSEIMPDLSDIVHTEPVLAQGYVTLDKVVYSTILGPAIGNFTFNWVGLRDEEGTLIAVSYVPPQYKYQTVGLDVGNTLTRNFLMEYKDAQDITGITVEAEAWQIDFLGRMENIHDDIRDGFRDFFGEGFFIGNSFLIYASGSTVYATAGTGYVGGWRCSLAADQVVVTGVLPKDIYIEAWIDADASSSDIAFEFKASPAGAPLTNYTDVNGVVHYLVKIASVTAGYAVTDLRKNINSVTHSIMQTLLDLIGTKAPLLSPALTGTPTAPTAANGTNTTQIANAAFVQAAIGLLIGAAPANLNTLVEIAAAINNDPAYHSTVTAALALKAPLASPALTGNPTAPTQLTSDNSTRLANTAFVKAAIAALIDSSPTTLDTLNELAAALGDDPNFATTMATALGLKAPLASPALTGTPTAPTAANGTNTTQLSTTAFVQAAIGLLIGAAPTNLNTLVEIAAAINNDPAYHSTVTTALALKAPLASPALTGNPTAPTQLTSDNSTRLANTAFVKAAIAALIDSSPTTLDTLNELAAALGDDPNFATTMATALGLKAPLASPALTGTPTAPTAANGTNTTQIANAAFVQAAIGLLIGAAPANLNTLVEIAAAINNDPAYHSTVTAALALKAPLASPALTGNPTAPTQLTSDNSTRLANTAFVKAAIAALIDSSPTTLDTLNELAAALGDDPNFATTMATALGLKAPLLSPALTGTPTAPTAANGTNTTQIANAAFVQAAINSKVITLRKTASQSVVNSVTLVDAADLSVFLSDNTFYHVRASIYYNCGAETENGIRVSFTGANSFGQYMWIANTATDFPNTAPIGNGPNTNILFKMAAPEPSANNQVILFDGVVEGNGATFKMQFAQNNSNATPTILAANTCVVITKLT